MITEFEFKDSNDKNLNGIFIDTNKLSSAIEIMEKSYDFNNLDLVLADMQVKVVKEGEQMAIDITITKGRI